MSGSNQALYELQERAGKMLGSQRVFLSAPEEQSILSGGFGSGKSHAMCVKGLILSSLFPGNRGLIGRYHSTDLEDSTIPVFFDVCPPSWIRSYNKQSKRMVLKNGSEILFRHLHDASAQTKSRRVGANLGWAAIDQLEECEIGHWNTLLGRLRLPAAKKKFLFATMNPAGHDDFYKLFFEGIDEDLRSLPAGTFHRVIRKNNRLGIIVNSNENRTSNGGFVDDGYFDEMISSYPQEWVDRYIYCSFADFAGKIYRAYNLTSVHNIKSFSYPKHWNCIVGIDVGGDAPWAVLDERIDEFGNILTVNEFYKPSVNVAEVANWIKANTPWADPNTIFIIDYENKLAMLELAEHGIHCRPAVKTVKPGILRTGGYYTVQRNMGLPSWYRETQEETKFEKFKDAGSPRAFVTENCVKFRGEMDNYLWDKNDKPRKINDHACLAGWVPVQTTHGAVPIADLVGKEGYCYSYDLVGKRVVAGHFWNVHQNGEKQIIRVHLDDASFLDVTEDHPFLLRTKIFQEAGKLSCGDSLMPFMCCASRNRWVRIKLMDDSGKWSGGHQIVMETVFGEASLGVEFHVHHKDGNAWNNDPENLEYLSRSEHPKADWVRRRNVPRETFRCVYCGSPFSRYLSKRTFCNGNCSRLFKLGCRSRKQANNHKVLRIEYLNQSVPVFDLTVEKYHNFAAGNIFVSNCDADRYIKFSRPIVSKLPAHDKYKELRNIDGASAREWEAFDKRMQARVDKRNGRGSLRELDLDEVPMNMTMRAVQEYEWGD